MNDEKSIDEMRRYDKSIRANRNGSAKLNLCRLHMQRRTVTCSAIYDSRTRCQIQFATIKLIEY